MFFKALSFFKSKTEKIWLFSVGKAWSRKCIWTAYWHSLQIFALLTRSVTIEVTNFNPPVKTLVPNSCLKLNSISYISQNKDANEGSVHCADIEGINVKPGSANSFGCRTLGKIPDISLSPERVELLRSHLLTNTGAFGLTPTIDIYIYLAGIERQWARNIIINTSAKGKWQTFIAIWDPSMRMVFPVRNRKSIFIYSWRLVCLVASCHALQSSVGSSA